jgi:hypothetical protein
MDVLSCISNFGIHYSHGPIPAHGTIYRRWPLSKRSKRGGSVKLLSLLWLREALL